MRRNFAYLGVVVLAVWVGLLAAPSGTGARGTAAIHPATGVGSCTLKNWNPSTDPEDATDLPEGHRPQTYTPDDYNCTGAKFARNGAEWTATAPRTPTHCHNR